MQKYNGVKQIAAKEKVAQKRQQERLARTFSKYMHLKFYHHILLF